MGAFPFSSHEWLERRPPPPQVRLQARPSRAAAAPLPQGKRSVEQRLPGRRPRVAMVRLPPFWSSPMYDRNMPAMRAYALASPQGLIEVIAFVLCTIASRFPSSATACATSASTVSASSARRPRATSTQSSMPKSFSPLSAKRLRTAIPPRRRRARQHSRARLVKAGFAAQIIGPEVACLDSHHLR